MEDGNSGCTGADVYNLVSNSDNGILVTVQYLKQIKVLCGLERYAERKHYSKKERGINEEIAFGIKTVG